MMYRSPDKSMIYSKIEVATTYWLGYKVLEVC